MVTINTATPPRSTIPRRNTILNPTDMRSVNFERSNLKLKMCLQKKDYYYSKPYYGYSDYSSKKDYYSYY